MRNEPRAVKKTDSLGFIIIEITGEGPKPRGLHGFQFPPRKGDFIPFDPVEGGYARMWEVIAVLHACYEPDAERDVYSNCGDVYVRDIGEAIEFRTSLEKK